MQSPVKLWRNQKHISGSLGKIGTIVSWTVVRVPPGDFSDQAPYAVALISLEDGKRITCQMVDCDPFHIAFGQRVITVIRRVTQPDADGVIPYGIKAKLLV